MKTGPASRHSYVIHIPGFKSVAFLISNASMPTPTRGSTTVSYMGETYSFPNSVELAQGDFTATMYETSLMEVYHAFYNSFIDGLKKKGGKLFEVDIYSFQMDYSFSVHTRLLGCWVKSLSPMSVDGSAVNDVVTCGLTLAYNGVELVETDSSNPTANLVKALAYHSASKAATMSMGLVDSFASAIGRDTSLSAKAKGVDLVTSNVVSGVKLLNSILTSQ